MGLEVLKSSAPPHPSNLSVYSSPVLVTSLQRRYVNRQSIY